MTMEFPACLYIMPSTSQGSQITTKPQPTHLFYESFLQSLSDDIQRYQAMQRLTCGHSDCKAAYASHMSKVQTVR